MWRGKHQPPGGPGIFAPGVPGILKSTLEKSGYTEVTGAVVPVKLTLGSANEALEMMVIAYGNYRTVVADLSEDAKEAAWSEIGEFLQHFGTDNEWQVDLEIVIGSGMAWPKSLVFASQEAVQLLRNCRSLLEMVVNQPHNKRMQSDKVPATRFVWPLMRGVMWLCSNTIFPLRKGEFESGITIIIHQKY